MNLYLKGGILSLRQMKEHYNRFEDGGEVDNVHSTPEQAWMVNWINNRQEVLKENIRDTKDFPALYSDKRLSREAFEEAQKQSRRVLSVKQYNYGRGPQFPTVPDDLYKKARNNVVMSTGTYIPVDHSIIYNRYNNPGRTTQVHELTHSMGANPQLDMLLHDKNLPHKNLREGIEKSSYLDSYQEVYPRLMELRRFLNLDPKKRDYTPKDLEEMRKKVGNTNLLDRYSDKYLLNLLNNIASNKATIETDGRKLAAYGGPLRDEYDNPDQYYDYKTAEEVGNMYDPGTQHWASRDPRTGMILKNSKHPTFGMAIREDQSSGYAPFIDSSTGRYYTLRPEEYATAQNKHTLRKVSNSEMEALYKEHNIDSWSRRKDFGKVIPGYTREEIDRRRSPYRDTLWEAAKSNNINPEILDALATVESRYDNDATSDAGAKGIMQLMPVNTEKIDSRDGHQNIKKGAEVLSSFIKENKGNIKKAIAAYNGYTKNPGAKVAKEERKYTNNYYKVLYPLIDSLEKNSTIGFPFDQGGKMKRDSTQPILRPISAGNFQEKEPEYTGPVVGEIRADERSKTQKFFDKIRTNYNSSSFGNSAVAEVLSATTPYGIVHEGMQGNSDSALLSIVPFGAEVKSGANVGKAAYKVARASHIPKRDRVGYRVDKSPSFEYPDFGDAQIIKQRDIEQEKLANLIQKQFIKETEEIVNHPNFLKKLGEDPRILEKIPENTSYGDLLLRRIKSAPENTAVNTADINVLGKYFRRKQMDGVTGTYIPGTFLPYIKRKAPPEMGDLADVIERNRGKIIIASQEAPYRKGRPLSTTTRHETTHYTLDSDRLLSGNIKELSKKLQTKPHPFVSNDLLEGYYREPLEIAPRLKNLRKDLSKKWGINYLDRDITKEELSRFAETYSNRDKMVSIMKDIRALQKKPTLSAMESYKLRKLTREYNTLKEFNSSKGLSNDSYDLLDNFLIDNTFVDLVNTVAPFRFGGMLK